jgi:hypothetical protein
VKGKPNLPLLPRGQKYELKCCWCGSSQIVRGTTQIHEPDDVQTWQASECVQEYACDRQTCGKQSFLVVRVTADGVTMQWNGTYSLEARKADLTATPEAQS